MGQTIFWMASRMSIRRTDREGEHVTGEEEHIAKARVVRHFGTNGQH